MLAEGETEIEAVLPPFDQAYDAAPLAVRVAAAPAQTVAQLAVTVGLAFTVTRLVAVAVQPAAFVPVTV